MHCYRAIYSVCNEQLGQAWNEPSAVGERRLCTRCSCERSTSLRCATVAGVDDQSIEF